MPRYLLDTDTFIYIQRRHPSAVERRFAELRPGDAVVSVIVYGELMYGAYKSKQTERSLRALDELLELVAVLPLPEEAAAVYGTLRALLERKGQIIGNNDLWIAAHAKAAGLTLVTNNVREFRRIPGLKVENWAA